MMGTLLPTDDTMEKAWSQWLNPQLPAKSEDAISVNRILEWHEAFKAGWKMALEKKDK